MTASMDSLEKVARAIFAAATEFDPDSSRADRSWKYWTQEAEAAIAAIPAAVHISTLEARVRELDGLDPETVRIVNSDLQAALAMLPEAKMRTFSPSFRWVAQKLEALASTQPQGNK